MMRIGSLSTVVLAVLVHGVAAVGEVKGGESNHPQIPGDDVYSDDLNYPALEHGDDFTNSTVGVHMSINFGDTSRSIGIAVDGV